MGFASHFSWTSKHVFLSQMRVYVNILRKSSLNSGKQHTATTNLFLHENYGSFSMQYLQLSAEKLPLLNFQNYLIRYNNLVTIKSSRTNTDKHFNGRY